MKHIKVLFFFFFKDNMVVNCVTLWYGYLSDKLHKPDCIDTLHKLSPINKTNGNPVFNDLSSVTEKHLRPHINCLNFCFNLIFCMVG